LVDGRTSTVSASDGLAVQSESLSCTFETILFRIAEHRQPAVDGVMMLCRNAQGSEFLPRNQSHWMPLVVAYGCSSYEGPTLNKICQQCTILPLSFGIDRLDCRPVYSWHDEIYLVERSLAASRFAILFERHFSKDLLMYGARLPFSAARSVVPSESRKSDIP